MKARLAPLRGTWGVDRPQPVVSACGLNHRLLSQIPSAWNETIGLEVLQLLIEGQWQCL